WSGGLEVADALAAAPGAAIFEGRGALAVAVLGDGEDELLRRGELGDPLGRQGRRVLILLPRRSAEVRVALVSGGSEALEDGEGDHLVAVPQADAADARGGARLEFAHVGGGEADGGALLGGGQDVV